MLTAGDFQRKGKCPTKLVTPSEPRRTSMRTRMLGALFLILTGCASVEQPQDNATLSIQPTGNQTASGPVTVTASPPEPANDITCAPTGPGSHSAPKGISD